MSKVSKFFGHLLNGTLSRRVYFEKIKKESQKNELEWDRFIQDDREFIMKEITEGIQLKLYKDSTLSRRIFLGNFEFQEKKFIESYLEEGDTFIDIGANIGFFSVIASKEVGANGKIFSFEPTSKTFERLEESIHLNGLKNVSLHQIALSNVREERELVISMEGDDQLNSLGRPARGENFLKEKLTTETFDDFTKENSIEGINLIKIDVEGWEKQVILGMRELLEKNDSVDLIVEFTEKNAQLAGSSCQELANLFKSFGYGLYSYDWVTNILLDENNRENFDYVNLIVSKDRKRLIQRLNCRFSNHQ